MGSVPWSYQKIVVDKDYLKDMILDDLTHQSNHVKDAQDGEAYEGQQTDFPKGQLQETELEGEDIENSKVDQALGWRKPNTEKGKFTGLYDLESVN